MIDEKMRKNDRNRKEVIKDGKKKINIIGAAKLIK